jgi:cell wall-associated NlpC family hydrolase
MKNTIKYFCFNTVIPVRATHKDESEITTQLVFGEVAEEIETHNQWRKIRIAHDDYEGWIDHKQVIKISDEEFEFWKKNSFRQTDFFCKWKTSEGVFTSLRGANIPNNLKFKVGQMTFVRIAHSDAFSNKDISSIALSYLNAPYLWGGKTYFGIDCSGFTQAVYRFYGINLPRDAYEQANHGETIAFSDRKIGDIAFFHNAKNKITHVGILLEDDKFIHASGRVRIDILREKGIFHSDNGELTHDLTIIKRLIH